MMIHKLSISYRNKKKKDDNLTNHSLLACLRTYKSFFNLQTCPGWIEVNPAGATMYTSSFNSPCKKALFMSSCFNSSYI